MTMPVLRIRDTQRDNLMISEDTGDEDAPIAVLLFTPDMKDFTDKGGLPHHHIELDLEQCEKTHAWLGTFLENKKRKASEKEAKP